MTLKRRKYSIEIKGKEAKISKGVQSTMCIIFSITELKAYLNSFNFLLFATSVADDKASFDTCDSLLVLDLKPILTLLRDLAKYLTIMALIMDRIINKLVSLCFHFQC